MGDRDLPTERGYQLDLELDWQPKLPIPVRLNLTPFAWFFQNYIYLAPQPFFSQLPEGGLIYRYEATPAFLGGAEASITLRPLEALQLSLAGEFIRNYESDDGFPLPWTPPTSLLTTVGWQLPLPGDWAGALWVQAEGEFVAAQTQRIRNVPNTPAYQLLHARLVFRSPWQKLPFRVIVQGTNLTNRTYLRHLSRYRQLNLPEPARNFAVTLVWTFRPS
jgi:iron complex outermembrane receptor protein